MKISNIQPTKRGRFALFDQDGEFLFSVDGETLVKNDLHQGTQLDSAQLARLQSQSETRKAKDKALALLAVRDHAAGELYDKLRRTFDEHSAAAAVAEMQRLDLLNDADWARRRASYLAARHKSTREIARDLAAKGIDRDLIDQVLEELAPAGADGPSADGAACRALLRKQYQRKLAAGQTDKVLAALARRGFGLSEARQAIDEVLREMDLADEPGGRDDYEME